MKSPSFRKEALEAAEHAEDVQRNMRVTASASRLVSLAVAVGLVLTLVWSYFVYVPIHVSARGVLVYSDQSLVRKVKTAAGGVVSGINVQIGDSVEVGDVIARLDLPDQVSQLEEQRRALAAKQRDVEALRELRAFDDASDALSFARREAATNTQIENLRERLDWLEVRLSHLTELRDDGVVTQVTVAEAQEARAQAEDALASAEADLVVLSVEHEAAKSQRERDALAEDLELRRLADNVELLAETLQRNSTIRADTDGRVVSIDAHIGDLVATGDTLFGIEPTGEGPRPRLEAAVFVGLGDGKQVEIGDTARLAPADLPATDRSRVLGAVRSVSDVPASQEALQAEIGDDSLVREISDLGPTFAARIVLDAPADDPHAYTWTTSGDAPATLTSGTPVETTITVQHVRLLALAVPAIRRLLEGDAGTSGGGG